MEAPRPCLEFRIGIEAHVVEAWLRHESREVLTSLDLDGLLLKRRPYTDELEDDLIIVEESEFVSRFRSCLAESEFWRRGSLVCVQQVMIYEREACVGFCTFALFRRPDGLEGQCRICWENASDEELLEDACGCRGSVRHVHASCLVQLWQAQGKPVSFQCCLCKLPLRGRAALAVASVARTHIEEHQLQSDLTEEQEKLLWQHVSVATVAWQEGRLTEATATFREAIAKLKALYKPGHQALLTAQHNLGLVLQAQGELTEAAVQIDAASKGFALSLGQKHPLTLKTLHNLALIEQRRGNLSKAEQSYQHVLELRREVIGTKHVDTLKSACNLGLIRYSLRKTAEAAELLRTTLQDLEQVVGRHHPIALIAMQNLSLAISEQDSTSEEALSLAREAAECRLRLLGEENAETFEAWRDLAAVLMRAGFREESERVFRQALRGQERLLGFEHVVTQQTIRQFQKALEQWGDEDASRRLGEEYNKSTTVTAAPLPTISKLGPLVAVVLGLYVCPAHRGRGVGKATMEHWKAAAQAAFAEALEVWVPILPPPSTATEENLRFFHSKVGLMQIGGKQVASNGATCVHLREDV